MVKPPSTEENHQDRPLECEKALTPGLDALAGWAAEAGWTEVEADRALLRLILARILASKANTETPDPMLEENGGLQ